MRSRSSLSRRGVLLLVIISPALLGSEFRCVVASNPDPTLATAVIERIEPVVPRVGEVVLFTGSGNGAPPLQFAWDFGDGMVGTGTQAAHAYLLPGSYRVTFTVRDINGNAGRDEAQVDVLARIPSSIFLISEAVAGEPVLFGTLPLEGSDNARSYVWTFSDGQSAIGPRAAAIFPVAGMYVASVAVTSDLEAIAVAQVAFHVADAPR
jgi:PKD domain